MQAHLRVARSTSHLDEVLAFYRDGKTYEDADGYRVVLDQGAWENRGV